MASTSHKRQLYKHTSTLNDWNPGVLFVIYMLPVYFPNKESNMPTKYFYLFYEIGHINLFIYFSKDLTHEGILST